MQSLYDTPNTKPNFIYILIADLPQKQVKAPAGSIGTLSLINEYKKLFNTFLSCFQPITRHYLLQPPYNAATCCETPFLNILLTWGVIVADYCQNKLV